MKQWIWMNLLFLGMYAEGAAQDTLIYHRIVADSNGHILPWYDQEPGIAYDHVLGRVWHFWDTMRTDLNGLPYYMNHQVWRAVANDPRGLGGDQFNMALSSWRLYYAYSGNERVKENMRFIADYYLTHSLSPPNAAWPDIPYPYNTLVYSGVYDGDMVIGKNFTQPDKAGQFGFELVQLYKMTSREPYPNQSNRRYLEAAVKIANTLAAHCEAGDENRSPLPFKVNAVTGDLGELKENNRSGKTVGLGSYTSNWTGTMELFRSLRDLSAGDTLAYGKAYRYLLDWMLKYPLQNNRWGPFFEDIPGWSDTQINAVSFAQFIIRHHQEIPDWEKKVQGIFRWVYEKLGNRDWERYGVVVVNEQTAYQTPGNSHTSRQACAELQFLEAGGDWPDYRQSVRRLNWATYMVADDGRNRYPLDENWLTDGYGDYVRHYIGAMAAAPELAPPGQDHLLGSSSVIQRIAYGSRDRGPQFSSSVEAGSATVFYYVFGTTGREVFRLAKKPVVILFDGRPAKEAGTGEGYAWKALKEGGILYVRRDHSSIVSIR